MTSRLPLFVYGTLRSGESQAMLLGTLGRRPAWIKAALYALPAGYPAAVLGGDGRVHGELVEAPDERLLQLLDQYEGVDERLFERVECEVRIGLRSARGWVYTMPAERARTGTLVRDGRWRSTRRR